MKRIKVFCVLLAVVLVFCALPLAASAAAGDLLNLQLYLIDSNSNALSNYIVVINNSTQAVANKDGIASIPAADAGQTYDLKLFTPEKKQVGECILKFAQVGDGATDPRVGDGELVNGVDSHTIYYVTPNASLYIYIIGNPGGSNLSPAHPAGVSNNPLQPGKQASKPAQTAAPSASKAVVTNPIVYGYLIDVNGAPIAMATVKSQNDKTASSLSGVTESDGSFEIPGISEGEHSLYVISHDGAQLGELDLIVKTGSKTEIKDEDADPEIDIHTGAGLLYMNIQTDGRGNIAVLDVSEKPLASPATKEAEPTETPEAIPTTAPEVQPTEAPAEATTAAPAVTAAPQPSAEQPTGQGAMSDQTLLIIVVAIIAAAAVIIIVLVVKRTNRKYRR